jgi:hypothetical protein
LRSGVDEHEHQFAFARNFAVHGRRSPAFSGASAHPTEFNADDQLVAGYDLATESRCVEPTEER